MPGRRQPSEMTNEEFDALIEHSEALARTTATRAVS